MRKTLELDFVWEGSLGYTVSGLNQIQEADSRHLGKFQMNIGLSLEYVI